MGGFIFVSLLLSTLIAASFSEGPANLQFNHSINSDTDQNIVPAYGTKSVEESSIVKPVMELKYNRNRRLRLENDARNVLNTKVQPLPSAGNVQAVSHSVKLDALKGKTKKDDTVFRPLGHSPGIGHADIP